MKNIARTQKKQKNMKTASVKVDVSRNTFAWDRKLVQIQMAEKNNFK